MTMLDANLCYKKVCYKGTVLKQYRFPHVKARIEHVIRKRFWHFPLVLVHCQC